jgi:hypothetical protein
MWVYDAWVGVGAGTIQYLIHDALSAFASVCCTIVVIVAFVVGVFVGLTVAVVVDAVAFLFDAFDVCFAAGGRILVAVSPARIAVD